MSGYTDEEIMEHRLQWIEALESGEYKQAQEYLGRIDEDGGTSYCCLGVACVIAGLNQVHADHAGLIFFGENQEDVVLPDAVMDWLGVKVPDPCINMQDAPAISSLNDDKALGFTEIAELVKRIGFIPAHDKLAENAD